MSWSAERAEEHLLSLELFGMRFGLDRMRRLLTVLGSPQQSFRSVHVVGTNGKSSTTRFTAAILEAHGLRTGSYLSPHLTTFAERIRVGDQDISDDEFGAAIENAAIAASKVNHTLADGDRVTQFELLTAAALAELARQGVEVAVIEAGLGGRHDATNVIDAEVVVLTNVGLEHTRWLGPTVADIASEKLAVVRPGATLVLGEDETTVVEQAEAMDARIVRPGPPVDGLGPGFQSTNAALALAATRELLGDALDQRCATEAVRRTIVPGRFHRIANVIIDGAHNPAGIAALVEALEPPVVGVMSILDDKDAPAMLRQFLPVCSNIVFTSSSNPRALSPATLASLAGQLGGPASEVEADPRRALERAQEIAGASGSVVATGSIYLVADLLSAPGVRRASAL